MRILMIAPVPYLEPRGASFQVYTRIRALSSLGHQIDLVTYPVGEKIDIPGVRVFRTWVPFVRRIKVGPSMAKFPLDTALFFRALGILLTHRYDIVHTHLEAGYFGAIFSRVFRLPHVYDMHDNLAEQLSNSKFTQSKMLIGMMSAVVRTIIRSAKVVIIVYPELGEIVQKVAPGKPMVMIYNTSVTAADEAESKPDPAALAAQSQQLRQQLSLAPREGPVLVYTGTFEPYQGLDMIVDGMPRVLAAHPGARYVLVGGLPEQIESLRQRARALGVEQALRLPGRRDHREMPVFMAMADVLLSPRSEGTNTPLKLFSYLDAGRPILATDIYSNTQILSDEVSLLVDPTTDGLAEGTLALLNDPSLQQRMGQNARALAQREYSWEAFVRHTAEAYAVVTPGHATSPLIASGR